ncbi:hypothetical protein T439DRAFT_323679 [Meredithblackwellia eburnea MCA 4105]
MLSRKISKRHPQRGPSLPATSISEPPPLPPSDPVPREGTRPSDILINRLHEVKRITKSLAAYFEAVSQSHATQAKTLLNLSQSNTIQTPLPESSLFLPSPTPEGMQKGWSELLLEVKDSTRVQADAEAELAKVVSEQVVAPLKKLRTEIKAHIAQLDKEVNKLADGVVTEREKSVEVLTHLSKSIASYASTPLSLPAADDPFIVRSKAEIQMREQVQAENDCLQSAIAWQNKTEAFEINIWEKVGQCWVIWEQAHAKMLSTIQQHSASLHSSVVSVPPNSEWNYFASRNHLIPPTTPARALDQISFPGQNDETTLPVKEGVLERKKRFVRNWKDAFFVITPAGYLHEYRSSSAPLSKPHMSIFLPDATIGPLPEPGTSKGGRMKEPKFIITGRESEKQGSMMGTMKIKHKELERVYRGKSWEEVKDWWIEIEKHTKSTMDIHAKSLEGRQGPGPTAVQNAGVAAVAAMPAGEHAVEEKEDDDSDVEVDDDGSSIEEEFAEAHTGGTVVSRTPVEEKPEYTPTPGVLSGAERDVKVKIAGRDLGDANQPLADKANLSARASTSKRKIEETNISEAVAAAPSLPPRTPAATTSSPIEVIPLAEAPTSSSKAQPAAVSPIDTTFVPPASRFQEAIPSPAQSLAKAPGVEGIPPPPIRTTSVPVPSSADIESEAGTEKKKKGLFGFGKKKSTA